MRIMLCGMQFSRGPLTSPVRAAQGRGLVLGTNIVFLKGASFRRMSPRVGSILLRLCVMASINPAVLFAQNLTSSMAGVALPLLRAESSADLPDAPVAQASGPAPANKAAVESVSGTVTDGTGNTVAAAAITLENSATGAKRQMVSDKDGFFTFLGVPVGNYKVTIQATGFATWIQTSIPVRAGEDMYLPHIQLPLASTSTDVQVVYSQHEVAEEQLKAEEKQRVFGFFPNFDTTYVWNAEPLSAGQKMRLALKGGTDPVAFFAAGVAAGVEQWQNSYAGYGQGAQGYAKRYGAAYSDSLIGSMLGGGLLPVLFHQDPRFFYKADGTTRQRFLYAISTAVIRRSDKGNWQPDYSGIIGNFASGAISNTYYPSSDRGAGLVVRNASLGIAFGAVASLLREFVVPKLTTHGPGKP